MQSDYVEEELERLSQVGERLPVLNADSFHAPLERLLSKPALTVASDDTVANAIEKLRQTEYGAVCVTRDARLVGLLTERDLICHVIGVLDDYERLPVSQVMLVDPVRLRKDDPILYALHNMQAGGYRHIPIVDAADRPVSVVSIKDVVRFILSHFPDAYNVTAEPFRGPATRESG